MNSKSKPQYYDHQYRSTGQGLKFSAIVVASAACSMCIFFLLALPRDLSGSSLSSDRVVQKMPLDPALKAVEDCVDGDTKISTLRSQSFKETSCSTNSECDSQMEEMKARLEPVVLGEARIQCSEKCRGGRGYIAGVTSWLEQRINLGSEELVVAGEFCCRCS